MGKKPAVDHAVAVLNELREDSKIGKHKHNRAAERKSKLHSLLFGIPAIAINLALSIVLVRLASPGTARDWIFWASVLGTFSAAFLTAMQTFYNFQKMADGHRTIANRYGEVARESKMAICQYRDGELDERTLWNEVRRIVELYKLVNVDSESFPTSERDFKKADANKNKSVTPFVIPNATRAAERNRSDRSGRPLP
jgi:hypothetical protein